MSYIAQCTYIWHCYTYRRKIRGFIFRLNVIHWANYLRVICIGQSSLVRKVSWQLAEHKVSTYLETQRSALISGQTQQRYLRGHYALRSVHSNLWYVCNVGQGKSSSVREALRKRSVFWAKDKDPEQRPPCSYLVSLRVHLKNIFFLKTEWTELEKFGNYIFFLSLTIFP